MSDAETSSQCGEVDEVFGPGLGPVCTREKGHEGNHEAICQATGRHVSTWSDLPAPDGACFICDAPPEPPCEDHPSAPVGPRGCTVCMREAFADWLAHVGQHRICDGSGVRGPEVACPGCGACCTVETPCPAFGMPDEPWIPEREKHGPCGCCGEPIERHRRMPPLPEEPERPTGTAGIRLYGPGDIPDAAKVILR